ncbi:MAG: glycogen-binding domain-containing protein [Desulforhopalus sp.]
MKDYLISLFIDNELNLDEKIDFMEMAHDDQVFKDEAIELLKQEKLLHTEMVHRVPLVKAAGKREPWINVVLDWLRPASLFATGLALGAMLLLVRPSADSGPLQSSVANIETPYRFLIYRPDVDQAEIVGSFTGWQPISMKRIGATGYWSLTVHLGEGEYQYSYLIEGGQHIADPTVPERVKDDFGGENTIITIKV